MNIKDYAYIVEIAAQQSLTAAANRLCITQSALSKFLQRVEGELDTQLFYRRGKQLVLTPMGQLYVEKGREIVRLDQSLQDEMQKLRADGGDAIRLGYGTGLAEFVLEQLLPEYFSNPRLRSVSLHEDWSFNLVRAVENGQLDLCLTHVNEYRSSLQYFPLRRTNLVLAVPAGSPLIQTGAAQEGYPYPVIQKECWLQEPYIRIATLTQSGAAAEAYFSRLGARPAARLYVETVHSALSAVASGIGNCILTEFPFTKYAVSYLCLPDLAASDSQICLVTLKGAHPDQSQIYLERQIKRLFFRPVV